MTVQTIDHSKQDMAEQNGLLTRPAKMAKTQQILDQVDNIRKSEVDKCEYRVITLPNDLQVLLIHEADLDKASAALDVHIGSFSDPPDTPGLAHFLEHLLFMGTEKYPRENDYMEYLAAHGGHSNAFTDDEHTNYFFEVDAGHFEAALDRFAQFFVAPLFNADGTAREMQAVDSEHKKNLKDDMWRLHQLERTLSRVDHPYSHFGTGCMDTLDRPGIREAVIQFYREHYSANIMKAVLYGRESLDQLAEWAITKFGHVPNSSAKVSRWESRPWDHIGSLVTVKSVKEMQTLFISWQTDDIHPHNASKPDVYLSHLLGHEGPGSLLSYLKKEKNWALGLSAGFDDNFHGFSFLQISIELTPTGLKHIDDIIVSVYQYIALLRKTGPLQWVHEECARINELSFRFKDKAQSSSSYAYKLAGQLHDYGPERVLTGPMLIEKWDESVLQSILADLVVGNCRCCLARSGIKAEGEGWQREKWYGTPYRIDLLSEDLKKKCMAAQPGDNPALTMPTPNTFLPENLAFIGTIKTAVEERRRSPTAKGDLFFKTDDQFGLPKSTFYLELKHPDVFASPRNSVLSALFVDIVKDTLQELAYDATLAGLSYDLSSIADGIDVRVSGFSDKAPVLLERILGMIKDPRLPSVQFDSIRDRFVRALRSISEEKPIWHASYYAGGLLQERLLHWREKLQEAEAGVTMEEVVRFGQRIVAECRLVALVNGNESEESAGRVFDLARSALANVPKNPDYQTVRSVQLQAPSDTIFSDPQSVSNPNSAIEFYLQADGGLGDARTRQLVQLFAQIHSEAFFDQLRTKEQLGYMVYLQVRDRGTSTGLRFAIQSERSPVYLEERIEAFLAGVVARLEAMEADEFDRYKASLASDLTARKKKLVQESRAFWEEIVGCRYDFEKAFVDAAGLAAIEKADLVSFCREQIVRGAPRRRKLSVHVWSEALAEERRAAYARPETTQADAVTSETTAHVVVTSVPHFVANQSLLEISYPIPPYPQ